MTGWLGFACSIRFIQDKVTSHLSATILLVTLPLCNGFPPILIDIKNKNSLPLSQTHLKKLGELIKWNTPCLLWPKITRDEFSVEFEGNLVVEHGFSYNSLKLIYKIQKGKEYLSSCEVLFCIMISKWKLASKLVWAASVYNSKMNWNLKHRKKENYT